MKHLRKFRIFESSDNDEDTKIYPGFEYSFADIKDTLYDILDLGFKAESKEHDYWSEKFDRNLDIIDAKWAVWNLKLVADVDCQILFEWHYPNRYSNQRKYVLNNSDLEFEVLKNIADIRKRFKYVYHKIEIDDIEKTWILFITIMSEINEKDTSIAKSKKLELKTQKLISDKIDNLFIKIRNIGTPKFKSISSKNKLGENSHWSLGKISEGYICIFINTNGMTNQVKKSIEQIEDSIAVLKNWYLPEDSKIELRKFTTQDCQKLSKIHKLDQKYFEDRYLDLDGVFIEYNYEKWYNDLKNQN